MAKVEIRTDKAPPAIGPYSQALSVSAEAGLVFVSGAIPIVPETGQLAPGGMEEQTAQVMKNIEAVLHAAGLGLSDVVKTTVYLADLSLFEAMNCVYAGFFTEPYPARATVEVSKLPKGVAVEIDAIAVRKEGE